MQIPISSQRNIPSLSGIEALTLLNCLFLDFHVIYPLILSLRLRGDGMPEKRKKKPEQPPTFNFSDNFRIDAGIVNMGGEQTFHAPIVINLHSNLEHSIQSIRDMPSANLATREELIALTGQLKEALDKIPLDAEEQAEKVTKRLQALLEEAGAKKPDREMVKISADGLKRAAENLVAVIPSILPICVNIIKLVSNL